MSRPYRAKILPKFLSSSCLNIGEPGLPQWHGVSFAQLHNAVGHPDVGEFSKATNGARTLADLESAVHRGLGRTGLMMFMEFDHGAILRKETGL